MIQNMEFTPEEQLPPVYKQWLYLFAFNLIICLMHLTRSYHNRIPLNIGIPVLIIFNIIYILSVRTPLKITLVKQTNLLEYRYYTFFRQLKIRTVYIPSAYFTYKRTGAKFSMKRLLIYNNYFTNKIDLTAVKNGYGFTTEQLDSIVDFITQLHNKNNNDIT